MGAQPAALRPLAAVINDDNTGESRGDGDGMAEPGETIELTIPLHNDGSQPAHERDRRRRRQPGAWRCCAGRAST